MAVASFVGTLFLNVLAFMWSFTMLFMFPLNLVIIPYLTWVFVIDRSRLTGTRKSEWFRSLSWWKHFSNFFPVKLIKTAPIDPDGKYIFGYHPHGIISYGAVCAFGTEGCGFSKLFPGIDIHMVTLNQNFFIPFLREVWLSLGLCSADKKAFHNVLKKSGKAMLVVVGGAAESLKSKPGHIELVLSNRKGFVRQALVSEASLVPVLAFGETDVYDIEEVGWAVRIQKRLQKAMGFAIPLFHGRGIFNYELGLLPHRRPIHVVVGAPVATPRADARGRRVAELGEAWLAQDEEGRRLVDETHAAYVEAVRALFDAHKGEYLSDPAAKLLIE